MILLIQYNKVINSAFKQLSNKIEHKLADLNNFGDNINLLSYQIISQWLQTHQPFDKVIIGDVFWPTGQHICQWCKENKVQSYFLQHGQWIYTPNKMNPKHVPDYTCLFGGNIHNLVRTWPYANRSRIEVTGSPRYDATSYEDGEFIYFAPPVLSEVVERFPDKWNGTACSILQQYKGLDKEVDLVIHPHYREGAVGTLQQLFPDARFLDVEDDPLAHISKCKSVFTHRNSTSVLDAIACHKPSVLMETPSFYDEGYFGPFAYEAENMKNAIKGFDMELDVYNYDEEAYPYIYLGNASNRIADVMKD